MMDGAGCTIRYPWEEPPEHGQATEVAEGVRWIRLPLPMALDHVNIYALDEGDSWTIVDTGIHSRRSVALWESVLSGPLASKPVGRLILTHHHPDHIGMAGWLMDRFGAGLTATRTSWLMARMLILDEEERPTAQALKLWRAAGMDEAIYDERKNARPFNFADTCHPLPVGYTRVKDGDVLRAAGRDWDVHTGNGHAPEHLTLWSRDDNLVLAGDQILPSISPNIGVYPTEPEADPVADWLESCAKFQPLAQSDHFVLPGHKLPFTGLPTRLDQMIENHVSALDRLEQALATPSTAVECFVPVFKREIRGEQFGLAMVEAVAHCQHLVLQGRATRQRRDDGAWVYTRV